MVLKFQFLLWLVAPNCYCACDGTLECGCSLGFAQGPFLPGVARSRVTFGQGPQYIVQPGAGDSIYFLFYVISAAFTFFFIVFLPPTEFFFQALLGKGAHSVMNSHTQGGKQLSLSTSKLPSHGHSTHSGSKPILALLGSCCCVKRYKIISEFSMAH